MREETSQNRLERNCHMCVSGQVAAAQIDLFDWQRHDDCPLSARILLASLFAKQGQLDDALAVLPRAGKLPDIDDVAAAQLLITLLVSSEITDAPARVLQILHHDAGHHTRVMDWIGAMQMPGSSKLGESDAKVDQLAEQLYKKPQVIESLVAAQHIHTDQTQIVLLRQALSRLWRHADDDEHRMRIIKSQAQLALMAGALDDARRWAQQGLELNPYNAQMAMVIAKVPDDLATGEPAAVVLDRVSLAHPTYPDVKCALIELEHTQGKTNSAITRLKRWLRQEPEHPMATDLSRRLAA